MSLKAIDMQIAVQKSTETGMKQNQLLNKPVLDQAMLATNIEKNTNSSRHRSNKLEETANHVIRDDQENGKNKFWKQQAKKKSNPSGNEPDIHASINSGHPYKGKHIDFLL